MPLSWGSLNPAMVGRVQKHSAAALGPKLLGYVTPHTWLGAGGVCMCLTNSSQVALWGPGPSPAVSGREDEGLCCPSVRS